MLDSDVTLFPAGGGKNADAAGQTSCNNPTSEGSCVSHELAPCDHVGFGYFDKRGVLETVVDESLRFLCSLLLIFVLLVRPGKNHPNHTVGELQLMKAENEANRYVEQLHIAQKLCFVDGHHLLDGLQFQ